MEQSVIYELYMAKSNQGVKISVISGNVFVVIRHYEGVH